MVAPDRIETERLVLRRPERRDVLAIYERYAGDAAVTRYVGWPRHQSAAETEEFLDFSEAQWECWPAGPYLIELGAEGVVGATGFSFETPYRAATGYVLARDVWGRGLASEALRAMVAFAPMLGVQRLYAVCHTDHRESARVLEKCGFAFEGVLRRYAEFPNLLRGTACDVRCYGMACP